jgi:hypothetical protein
VEGRLLEHQGSRAFSSPLAAHPSAGIVVNAVQHRLPVTAPVRRSSPTAWQVVEVPRRVGEDELVAARAADLAGGDERRPAFSLGSVGAPVSPSFRGRPAAHRSIGLERDGLDGIAAYRPDRGGICHCGVSRHGPDLKDVLLEA